MTTKTAEHQQKHSVGINRGGGYWCASCGDLKGPCEHFPSELRAARAMLEALETLEQALRSDSRQKDITGDTVEYHLEGQAMFWAINKVRVAIRNSRVGEQELQFGRKAAPVNERRSAQYHGVRRRRTNSDQGS